MNIENALGLIEADGGIVHAGGSYLLVITLQQPNFDTSKCSERAPSTGSAFPTDVDPLQAIPGLGHDRQLATDSVEKLGLAVIA
jgi:hypothetical protein